MQPIHNGFTLLLKQQPPTSISWSTCWQVSVHLLLHACSAAARPNNLSDKSLWCPLEDAFGVHTVQVCP